MVDFNSLSDALSILGYDPRPYSGRGMYGKECLSVVVEWSNDQWVIAQALALRFGETTPAPDSDSLGRNTVLYWSQIEWEGAKPTYADDDQDAPA